ncbi:unnamed protein product [Closterium sp. NIES-53]
MGAGLVSETLHAPTFLAGWRRWRISRWGKSAVVDPCLAIFRRGADPKQLAFSLALGFVTGLFPLCGLTAALCAVVAYVLRSRSHGPTMMFATFLATPVEVSLIIPYMRLGEFLARSDHLAISPAALLAALSFSHSGGKASARLLLGLVHAVLAWLVTAPLLVWLFYRLLLPLAVRFTRRAPLSHVTTGIVIGSSSGVAGGGGSVGVAGAGVGGGGIGGAGGGHVAGSSASSITYPTHTHAVHSHVNAHAGMYAASAQTDVTRGGGIGHGSIDVLDPREE